MNTPISKNRLAALCCGIGFLNLSIFALTGEMKAADDAAGGKNQIEIKDFHFSPETLTVKSGEKITWINRDDEPHTIVSVEKQFKKSPALDTNQEFTITASAPGTYSYYCSVHPKMTGTIIVEKP
ncbi:MAG: cupredoxin family copper-binding protein [Chthoniobacterales bacterium]